MSQSLPLTPQLPSLDGRLSVQRDRPADNGERNTQRHNFGRLLDRFTQSERSQDTSKDPVTAPQEQRPRERCSTADDSPRPAEDATASDKDTTDAGAMPAAPGHATAAAADPAKPASDAGPAPGTSAPAPVAIDVQAVAPVVATAAPAAPAAATSFATEAVPVAPTVAAAMPAVAAEPAAAADGPTPFPQTPAAATAPKAAALPAEPVAGAAAPEATAETFALAPIAVPPARARRAAAANGAAQPSAKTPAAAAAEKMAGDITAPQLGRLTAARVEADASAAANSNQAPMQARILKVDANAAAVDATTLGAAHEERDASGADQAVANLTSIDSPRRTAALYHKVADAAKPGADTPTPADQISIRLVHAVAEGKRAIQMHLHPAELGSIDVKMQWQGDKLTAQFTVDRPETLQLLQREVSALERSLGQAGVNVDSGSLSFSLRQQQGNGKSGGDGFDQAAANAGLGDGGELAAGEDTLGQVIRDGILSIRV